MIDTAIRKLTEAGVSIVFIVLDNMQKVINIMPHQFIQLNCVNLLLFIRQYHYGKSLNKIYVMVMD